MTAAALLTDSTWSMPDGLADERGIGVLPLQVTAGPRALTDVPGNAEAIDSLLASGRGLGTSQPGPVAILEGLHAAAAQGAERILGVFVSSELSGTCESVRVAAAEFTLETGIPVTAVDSRTVAAGTGLAVLAASDVLRSGGDADLAEETARTVAASVRVCFTVPDLMHLKRGGRLPVTKAIVGRALGVHPLLEVREGKLELVESVRGASRATARLRALAFGQADAPARVVVLHADAQGPAAALAEAIAGERPDDDVMIAPISRTLRVHTGPGALGLAVTPR